MTDKEKMTQAEFLNKWRKAEKQVINKLGEALDICKEAKLPYFLVESILSRKLSRMRHEINKDLEEMEIDIDSD